MHSSRYGDLRSVAASLGEVASDAAIVLQHSASLSLSLSPAPEKTDNISCREVYIKITVLIARLHHDNYSREKEEIN